MQTEDTINGVQFGRLDEFRMRDGDCEQRSFEFCFPEREEILQRREIRKHIVVLPDVALQEPMATGATNAGVGGMPPGGGGMGGMGGMDF